MSKPTEIDQKIGQKIEFHRKLRSKTRNWLASKLGVSYHQIQNYEVGRNRVSASSLYSIAESLKFPINNFFPNKNERPETSCD